MEWMAHFLKIVQDDTFLLLLALVTFIVRGVLPLVLVLIAIGTVVFLAGVVFEFVGYLRNRRVRRYPPSVIPFPHGGIHAKRKKHYKRKSY